MADDYSPIYAGDTWPAWTPTFKYKGGTALDLTSLGVSAASFSLAITNTLDGTPKTPAGSWSFTSGVASYSPATADTNTPGLWKLEFAITLPGGRVVHGDPKILEIKAL